MTDTVTGLIWLKQADCLSPAPWAAANNAAAGVKHGDCGLTDNSAAGDWRLPTKAEWEATVARALAGGCTFGNPPSLTNDAGTGCLAAGGSSFAGVASGGYWSSSSFEGIPDHAWYAGLLRRQRRHPLQGRPLAGVAGARRPPLDASVRRPFGAWRGGSLPRPLPARESSDGSLRSSGDLPAGVRSGGASGADRPALRPPPHVHAGHRPAHSQPSFSSGSSRRTRAGTDGRCWNGRSEDLAR